MSTYEQDGRFYHFMGEVGELWAGNVDGESLLERVELAFEDDEITTSQYDKLVREIEDFVERG